MSEYRIEEIKRRLAAATPGIWRVGTCCVISDQKDDGLCRGGEDEDAVAYYGGYLIGESMGAANAAFIANAKADIKFLLTSLEAK